MTGNAHLNLKLSANSRCRCSGCREYFNSVGAFDKHRISRDNERRCLTVDEMLAVGMVMNNANYWVTAINDFEWSSAA